MNVVVRSKSEFGIVKMDRPGGESEGILEASPDGLRIHVAKIPHLEFSVAPDSHQSIPV